ncbi:MAG: sugar-binding domain-containing protein, partial [Candidatus Hinthialibacter sp.]
MNTFHSTRNLLFQGVMARMGILGIVLAMGVAESYAVSERVIPLDGAWRFTLDAKDAGLTGEWFGTQFDRAAWRIVQVPHTWQVEPENSAYYGAAWYARTIQADPSWKGEAIRLEFDAVYRDAWIWVNGKPAGEHHGSGWTPFAFSIEKLWKPGEKNHIAVRVDNRFSEKSLPYLRSSDWAADGGIIRSVRLRFLPASHIEQIHAHAFPDISSTTAEWQASVRAVVPVGESAAFSLEARMLDPDGRVASSAAQPAGEAKPGRIEAALSGVIANPQLWHFDYPRLYRLVVRLKQGEN